MTPQQLKSSILQRAIQGKLVPQIPAEGTGEELYQQIQNEKQALIKAGKIKKEKPLPPISEDEIPFEIPEGWRWCRFDDVFYHVGNKTNQILAKDVKKIGKYPAVSQGLELIDGYCDDDEKVIYDIPLIMFGDHTRNVKYIDFPFVISADGTKFLKSIIVNSKYLYYWMKISAEQLRNRGYARHFSLLSKLLIPLPPLAEQRRIVAKIEELMPLIDRYEKAWTQLEAMNKKFPGDLKKSILQMAIQGRLVPQIPAEGSGEELLEKLKIHHTHIKKCKDELNFTSMEFDIPENWKFVELNQLFNFVDYRGKTPHKINESSNGVFLITASNIKNGYMDYTRKEYISNQEYEDRKSRGVTKIGDLLFTTEAPMGNSAICDLEICSCGQRIITFQEYNKDTVVPKLFMFFILSPAFQQQLLDNCTGTTAKGIKADKLKHFLIPLPPLAEQRRIVAKIEELMPLIERLERS